MADVFLSYAREDRARAEQVARGLGAMGLDVFWDTDIPPGQTWSDYIEGKLGQARSVVVLWSQHSTKSQWVREEARMGRDKSKLIPVIIDGSAPPLGFGEVQAADLTNWQGRTNEPQWTRFANAVHAAARGADAPPQAPPQTFASQPSYAPSNSANASAPAASPIEYITKCLRMYADGKGRARRSEYGWFALFVYAVLFVAAVIDVLVGGINSYTGAANSVVFITIAGLALICPSAAAASRRAHDFGQSGWLAILTLIPYLGLLATLAFVFIPGQQGDNQHGPDPKAS